MDDRAGLGDRAERGGRGRAGFDLVGVGLVVRDSLIAVTPRLVARGSSAAHAAQTGFWRLTDRAASRGMVPNSLTGISLLLAFCAAAWFSGGTAADNLRGTLALSGWLLARVSARRLATADERARQTGRLGPAGSRPGLSGALDGGTDWLVLPGAIWEDAAYPVADGRDEPAADAGAGLAAIPSDGVRAASWLSAVSAVAAECAIYGGIAAGGQSAGWTGMWPLAVAAVVAVALRGTIGACRPQPAAVASTKVVATTASAAGRGRAAVGRATRRALAPSAGPRVALAAVALAAHGPRVALFTILTVEVISIGVAIVSAGRRRNTGAAVLTGAPSRSDLVLASRDDGAAARWAGRLVQGNLIPLPPAVAGVAATIMLAVLGMGHLPGIIALAPLAVLMLAAPGASHPHTGRFDWLTPVMLQGGQYLYLAALGFAWALPGPLVYSLCALTAIWYANLVAGPVGAGPRRGRDRAAYGRPTARSAAGIGWEGRMFAAGLGAMLGIATFAYIALAAYLGVLICRRVVAGYLLSLEDDCR